MAAVAVGLVVGAWGWRLVGCGFVVPLVAVVALVLLQLPIAFVLAVPGGARGVLGPACLKIP